MRRLALDILLLPLLVLPAAEQLAQSVASSCGLTSLPTSGQLRWTWTHHPSGKSRSYAWNLATNLVQVTMHPDDTVVEVPRAGPSGDDQQQLAAHQAFINDS